MGSVGSAEERRWEEGRGTGPGEEKSAICTDMNCADNEAFQRVVLAEMVLNLVRRIGDLRGFWRVRASIQQCLRCCVRISSGWYKIVHCAMSAD